MKSFKNIKQIMNKLFNKYLNFNVTGSINENENILFFLSSLTPIATRMKIFQIL